MKIKIQMQFKKATKNTYVFEEIDDAGDLPADFVAAVPTLYIRKHVFVGEPTPYAIEVEITT